MCGNQLVTAEDQIVKLEIFFSTGFNSYRIGFFRLFFNVSKTGTKTGSLSMEALL